jgi:hypothetical protein
MFPARVLVGVVVIRVDSGTNIKIKDQTFLMKPSLFESGWVHGVLYKVEVCKTPGKVAQKRKEI